MRQEYSSLKNLNVSTHREAVAEYFPPTAELTPTNSLRMGATSSVQWRTMHVCQSAAKRKQSGDTQRSSHRAAAHMGRGEEGKRGRVSYRIVKSITRVWQGEGSHPSLRMSCPFPLLYPKMFQHVSNFFSFSKVEFFLAFLFLRTLPFSFAISCLFVLTVFSLHTQTDTHTHTRGSLCFLCYSVMNSPPVKLFCCKSQQCQAPPRHTSSANMLK